MLSRLVTFTALVAMALTVVPAGLATAAPSGAPGEHKGLLGVAPTGTTALPGSRSDTWPKSTTSGGLTLSSRVTDPELAAKSLRDKENAQEFVCSETIDAFSGGVGEDDYLEETVEVVYDAIVECNYFLNRIVGVAGAFDRSPSFNGQVFDGAVIGGGTPIDTVEDFFGESVGGFRADAIAYDGARVVEPAFELYLLNPPGLVWGECGPLNGLRYLFCDGLGTELLHILVGTGPLGTGLTPACRDFTANLDTEQARLYELSGGTPASTQILRRINEVKNELTAFRRDLCGISSDAATGFVVQRGQRLWDTATRMARQGAAGGDDRPLYWARLGMVVALRQWVPPTFLRPDEIDELVRRLETTSRGMESTAFTGGGKRLFISGFDPFGLDAGFGGNIFNGNESGASVLRLDGQGVAGGQVQAVVFPVRYADFDQGLVEDVYAQALNGGADAAVSISEGVDNARGDFEPEVFNGRNRSTGPDFPDNQGADPPGTFNAPQPPLVIGAGPQFTSSTLPLNAIDNAAFTFIDRHVFEIRGPGQQPVRSDTGPTAGSTSVEGGGGGFLSNEIAYRVTRLRDAIGSSVPAGHIHTPSGDGSDGSRVTITLRCADILGATAMAV